MEKITIPKGDKGYNIAFTCTDADGNAKNLTGYDVDIHLWLPETPDTLYLDGDCVIDDAAAGTCHYTIAATDMADVGVYHGRLVGTKTGVQESLKLFALVIQGSQHYCTMGEIKSELDISVDDYNDILEALCEEVKAAIDDHCDRIFGSSVATKYYDGSPVLFIDDLITATSIKLDEDGDGTYEETMATSDYVLYPLNSTPKTYIKVSADSDYGGFASGIRKGVEVAGTWGYASTVPKPIRRAAKIQACRLFKRREGAFADRISTPELGEIPLHKGLDPDVKWMLRPYIRIAF